MRLTNLLIALFLTFLNCNFLKSQEFAPKGYYLVDSILLDNMNEATRQLLDSTLKLYHEENIDTIKLKHIGFFIGECWDKNVWPKYNRFLKEQSILKLKTNNLKPIEIIFYKKHYASAINNIGYLESTYGHIDKALKYYSQSLKLREEIGDKKGIGTCLSNIANIYSQMGENKMAKEFHNKCLELRKQISDTLGIAKTYNNIATLYRKEGDFNNAIISHRKSLKLHEELNNLEGVATSFNNLGYIYEKMQDYSRALIFHKKSLKIRIKIGDEKGRFYSIGNIGSIYDKLGNQVKSIKYLIEAHKIAESINNPVLIRMVSKRISDVYEKMNNHKKSYHYYKIYIKKRDEVINEENKQAAIRQNLKYKYDKKHLADSIDHAKTIEIKDITLKKQEAENKKQQIIILAFTIGFLITILLSAIIYRLYLHKKKANQTLQKQKQEILNKNEEITAQRDEIEAQRDMVTEQKEEIEQIHQELSHSIDYAKRIQTSILPEITVIKSWFSDQFVLFKPKDKVSGDFYWWSKIGENLVITVADCTGHGVPGAFMSMLGISYLNEITQTREIKQANLILNELRNQVKHSLRQHGKKNESKDGMDMALCVINTNNRTMQYSGAHNPLYLFRVKDGNSELKEYKADKMPIGFYHGKENPFTNNEIQLELGDTIYMFSDGFIDQFGGENNKKFMSKNFKKLLSEIQEKNLSEQKNILEKTLSSWMIGKQQMDDILVIGIKI